MPIRTYFLIVNKQLELPLTWMNESVLNKENILSVLVNAHTENLAHVKEMSLYYFASHISALSKCMFYIYVIHVSATTATAITE